MYILEEIKSRQFESGDTVRLHGDKAFLLHIDYKYYGTYKDSMAVFYGRKKKIYLNYAEYKLLKPSRIVLVEKDVFKELKINKYPFECKISDRKHRKYE
jgi:hypothetical protein